MAKKESKEKESQEQEGQQEESSPPNPAEMTVPEIKELVESGDLSGEQLEQLKEKEEEEKGRATALNVIEHAIEKTEAAMSDGSDMATGPDAIAAGRVQLERGNYAQAQIYFERARSLFEQGKDEDGISSCMEEMAILALLRGEQEIAQARYQEALDRYRQQGKKEAQIDVLQQMGLLHRMRGETAQMRACYDEARALAEGDGGASD